MKTVLSGIQPTGNLHLGNYLGSIRNWIDLQKTHRCIFGVMNLHAITLPQDPKELQQNVLDAVAAYIACGLDPKKSTIFVQSEVPEHAELAWVLGTLTPLGWLDRMIQFKEKSKISTARYVLDPEEIARTAASLHDAADKKDTARVRQLLGNFAEIIHNYENQSSSNLGLYAYPVLMASDILLYKADLVPVGEDQKQHLELTRDIAGAFNRRFGKEYFKLPEPMILRAVKRIMSLQDGTKKMSKSDESEISRINLIDSPEQIVKKIKKSKTDSFSTVTYDEARPEIYNLLNIFSAITDKNPEDIAKEYENSGYGKFKGDLADALVSKLQPIQEELFRLRENPSYLREILNDGQKAAREIAQKTRKEVFEIVGLS